MTTSTERAQKSMLTETCTSVIGSNGKSMARVRSLLKMEVNMLEVTSMIREKAKANFITKTDQCMMATGRLVRKMAKVF